MYLLQLGGGTGELGVWPLAAIGLYSSLWMSWTVWWRGLAAISVREESDDRRDAVFLHSNHSTASALFQMMVGANVLLPLFAACIGIVVVSLAVTLVGLISGVAFSAAAARLDADAHDWPTRHGTETRPARQTPPHKRCIHDRRPHIHVLQCLHPLRKLAITSSVSRPFLPAARLDGWTTVSQHDRQHNNNSLPDRHLATPPAWPAQSGRQLHFRLHLCHPAAYTHAHVHVATTTTTGTIHLVCMRRMQETKYRHSPPDVEIRPGSSPPVASRSSESCDTTRYYHCCRHRGHATR